MQGGRRVFSSPVTLPLCRPEEAGAEVPLLPLDALHVLAEQLDQGDLEQALLVLKLFIILCRCSLSVSVPCGPGRSRWYGTLV
jgi:hypothetical protein